MSLAGALAVLGAVALLVGLSLDWYDPEISAWTAFEIIDLLLAAIAVGVVAVALGRSPARPGLERAAGWLPAAALAAIVLVLVSIVNPPPAAIDRSVEVGAWVSLAGAALLVIAAVLATTEVSIVVAMRPRTRRRGRERATEASGIAAEEGGWQPVEEPIEPVDEPIDRVAEPIEPIEEPPLRDQPTEESAILGEEPFDEVVGPAEAEPAEAADSDRAENTETRPLPPRRED